MTARPALTLADALLSAACAALHVTPGQALDASFVRTLGNTVLAYHLDTRRDEWTPEMTALQQALASYAYATRDEALARMASGLGVTHAPPSEHDHLGRRYPCGLYEHREQYGSRHAAVTVSSRLGDRVTCGGCLAATASRREHCMTGDIDDLCLLDDGHEGACEFASRDEDGR